MFVTCKCMFGSAAFAACAEHFCVHDLLAQYVIGPLELRCKSMVVDSHRFGGVCCQKCGKAADSVWF